MGVSTMVKVGAIGGLVAGLMTLVGSVGEDKPSWTFVTHSYFSTPMTKTECQNTKQQMEGLDLLRHEDGVRREYECLKGSL